MRKWCSVKERECQNRSNLRRKLAKSVQIVTTTTTVFMRLLLVLQLVNDRLDLFLFRARNMKFFSSLSVYKFLLFYRSPSTFHISLRYTLCIADEVSRSEVVIEYLLDSNAILTQKELKYDMNIHNKM